MQNSVLCHSIIQTYISLKNLVGCAKSPSNLTRVKNSQKKFCLFKKKVFFPSTEKTLRFSDELFLGLYEQNDASHFREDETTFGR